MLPEYIKISDINNYIKSLIDNDTFLHKVYLCGEISNFKNHTRGHLYFTLKDDNARLSAVMFESYARGLTFTPEDGMNVLVEGRISVYPATGSYQIYVEKMEMDGIGKLFIEYEKLKKKLAEEGLFDEKYKKKIPKIPTRVGVVTAPTGAAIKDIISTIKRRWPLTEIYLFPSLVQGEDAKDDIVRQIQRADEYNLDTLIVGRGGGSIEDLWAFNEEVVARAIFAASTPIISAVGHEVDFTIADFVADLRAPTSTGAAELAVPQINDVSNYLNQLNIRLNKVVTNKINNNREILNTIMRRNLFKNPMIIYQAKEMIFDNILDRLKHSTTNLVNIKEKRLIELKSSYILRSPYKILDNKSNKYLNLVSKLETLSPLLTLKRGYTITKKEGSVVESSKKIKKGDKLDIEFRDGVINTEVI